jgi:hypothetical protein
MQFKIPKGPFCQSCAMPMEKEGQFGTNADGSKNDEYCSYCFKNGKFTEPEITLPQMIAKVSRIMSEMKMPEILIGQVKTFIPKLKRWQK